jgi:hypothetical protein
LGLSNTRGTEETTRGKASRKTISEERLWNKRTDDIGLNPPLRQRRTFFTGSKIGSLFSEMTRPRNIEIVQLSHTTMMGRSLTLRQHCKTPCSFEGDNRLNCKKYLKIKVIHHWTLCTPLSWYTSLLIFDFLLLSPFNHISEHFLN